MGWFQDMCEEMEAIHGERGWKRRLAEMLGVSDSNVQNWIRAGSAPPIVRTAYEAKLLIAELQQQLATREHTNLVIEEIEGGRGYRVLKHTPNSGLFFEVAHTRERSLAQKIVQIESGALDAKIEAVLNWAYDYHDHPDDRQQLDELSGWAQPSWTEQQAEVSRSIGEARRHAD